MDFAHIFSSISESLCDEQKSKRAPFWVHSDEEEHYFTIHVICPQCTLCMGEQTHPVVLRGTINVFQAHGSHAGIFSGMEENQGHEAFLKAAKIQSESMDISGKSSNNIEVHCLSVSASAASWRYKNLNRVTLAKWHKLKASPLHF